jgi:hypothetical protein
MMPLERRYAALLRLYPQRTPRDEMLDTLMAGAGRGQRWPTLRETVALLLGALRARTAADAHRTSAQFAHSASYLAALALLAYAAAHDVTTTIGLDVAALVQPPAGFVQYATAGALALILHLCAIIALARSRYRLAAGHSVLALAASWVAQWQSGWGFLWSRQAAWAALLATVLVLVLNTGIQRERSSVTGWLLAVPLALFALPTDIATHLGPSWHVQTQLTLALVGLALIWSVVDPRVPIAVSALTLSYLLSYVAEVVADRLPGDGLLTLGIAITAAPTAALLIAAGLARRRAVL